MTAKQTYEVHTFIGNGELEPHQIIQVDNPIDAASVADGSDTAAQGAFVIGIVRDDMGKPLTITGITRRGRVPSDYIEGLLAK